MRSLRVLDCTLRDGGCVNDFNFGAENMRTVKKKLDLSGVDIIECGYIDENKGSSEERTQFIDEVAIQKQLLEEKRVDALYVAMIDYGKFDCSRLHEKTERSIDGIRVAFHKKDRCAMTSMAKAILDKGYKLFVQPMAILRYSDAEILKLINQVNHDFPQADAFYIVDSFGEMRMDDFRRILYLVDNNLNEDISLGFHSHNNLQLSYANAIQFINYRTERNKIIDSSVMGMGKGAGNLNTELLLEHLNNTAGTCYNIQPLLDLVDEVLNQIYAEFKWGYSVEYYLSAKNKCTPSYARYFYDKHLMSIEQVSALLGMLDEDKKDSFDRDYADKIYFDYNNRKVNDEDNLNILRTKIGTGRVLLIAPGPSIIKHFDMIKMMVNKDNCFSIMLNMVHEGFDADYIFSNKQWIADIAAEKGCPLIMLSNMNMRRKGDIILDYATWSERRGEKIESAFEVIMNILSSMGINEVSLAGFDGFHVDLDKNYYDAGLKRNMSKGQVVEMNSKVRRTISYYKDKIAFNFITPSLYEATKT